MARKIKFILLFSFVFLSSFSVLKAQNAGFMGKRVIFNMGATFSPAWFNNFSERDYYKWHSFNYILSPNIEVIAWKGGTVGAVYHFFETKSEGEIVVENFDLYGGSTFEYVPYSEDIDVHGFGVFYKQYFHLNSPAPVGAYIRLQLDGHFYKSENEKGSLFGLRVELGKDFLFFNMLRFSPGISLGVPFSGYKSLLDSYGFGIETSDVIKEKILRHYWLLGFNINIGFIPF